MLLPRIRNMKASTWPVELADPGAPGIKKIPVLIPKKQWDGDWIINLENDIKFLAAHFQAQPGSYLWVRETHRIFTKTNPTDPEFCEVWVEYRDGEKRKTTILSGEVAHMDRWIPPLAMLRDATRTVLKVHEVDVEWADDKRTQLTWVIGAERVASPEYVLEMDKRGVLK